MDTIDDPHLRHLFETIKTDNINHNVYEQGKINLSVGVPGPDSLQICNDMMMEAATHNWEKEKKENNYFLYQYGITAGLWECREELAKFLTRRYGDPVKREELILTCGASHGLHILLSTILAPNGIIFLDEVTYYIVLEAFDQFPFNKVISVKMDNDVIDLDVLEELIKKEKTTNKYITSKAKLFWAMYYTMPTFHNPTGTILDEEKSKRLVNMAREHDIVVICDDIYNLFHYENEYPPRRLFYYDNPTDPDYKGGNVISNGTFSKILFPAARVGWVECKPNIAKILRNSGFMKSGGAVNHYMSGIITSLLHLKLQDKFLDRLIKLYKERMNATCQILDENLPKSCSYIKPKGGNFVWLKLPKEIDGNMFNTWCITKYNVITIPGNIFSKHGTKKNYLRISISFHEMNILKQGVQSLCDGLTHYISEHHKYV